MIPMYGLKRQDPRAGTATAELSVMLPLMLLAIVGLADFGRAAMEMITRCRAYDNLFNRILEMDLLFTVDFGNYCKRVFLAINSLKPAFPDSSVAVGTLDIAVKDLRKFVMMQNTPRESRQQSNSLTA